MRWEIYRIDDDGEPIAETRYTVEAESPEMAAIAAHGYPEYAGKTYVVTEHAGPSNEWFRYTVGSSGEIHRKG